ncbi:MAG: 2,3-bisphosphoglycerate-independent phosphoglycerate mutase [Chloroflexi bacterium]|nr:2,3-bisphosphoglycerate-independent phosphoglycerate mutase [Chloroflexota bacterium]
MIPFSRLKSLVIPAETKIVFLVMDGLGGLPLQPGGLTELETATTPHLDALASQSVCGLSVPVAPGITPGSGPAHLALFGYDPLACEIGRGVLEALGVDFDLQPQDVAARGNFCTVDSEGRVTDRRAGRISTDVNAELCARLRAIKLPGVEIFVEPVKDYRFILVLRGDGLGDGLTESDPQQLGALPHKIEPLSDAADPAAAHRTADLINEFVRQAKPLLADQYPANMFLLRGISKRPSIPTMQEVYGLNPLAIAVYPMYRGLAKLVGMQVLHPGETMEDEFAALESNWEEYNFFFVHIKWTDSAGEDGDFDRKVSIIEQVDAYIPRLMTLKPDVVVVTGDHSTPALLRSHSWHPIPTLIYSPYCRSDEVTEFSERGCARGALGQFPATDIMPLALANALRLTKFGA